MKKLLSTLLLLLVFGQAVSALSVSALPVLVFYNNKGADVKCTISCSCTPRGDKSITFHTIDSGDQAIIDAPLECSKNYYCSISFGSPWSSSESYGHIYLSYTGTASSPSFTNSKDLSCMKEAGIDALISCDFNT